MIAKHFRAALLCSSFVLIQPALAQNLPGNAIDTSTVATEVQALLTLAQQAYPGTLPSATASGWRLYSGYTFKYFAATGIYVGIKDGQVFLLGGPYPSITPYGTVAAVTTALQTRIANTPTTPTTTADFGGLVAAHTLADLIKNFRSLTMDYGSPGASAQISLEVLGQESVNGVSTDQVKVTIAGSGGSNPLVYDMWVDSTGVTRRLRQGTYDFGAQSELLGGSLVSGFLIALTAADQPQVKAALAETIQSPALSTMVTKRIVGDTTADTVKLTVAIGAFEVTSYISDFGSFSMMTQYSARLGTFVSNAFEIVDMELR